MKNDPHADRPHQVLAPWLEGLCVLLASLGFLSLLGASAPFTKELGACESGAVREVMAGALVLPHYGPGMKTIVITPPLSWWLQALAVRLLGWRELALRAPSLLAAAFTAGLLYAWLGRNLGRACALWSVAVLLSARLFVDAARQPRQDALFTALLSGAMVCMERSFSAPRARRRRWLAALALLMALATLAKGPHALVLPGLVLLVWAIASRRAALLLEPAWAAAFCAALLLLIPWYAAAYAVGGAEFLHFQLGVSLWRRFTRSAGMCDHPSPFFFLPFLVTAFLPWGLFLPAAGVELWRRRRRLPSELSFALCWFAVFLVFVSASRGKCVVYLVPVFVPLAAIIGWTLAQARVGCNPKQAGHWPLRLAALLAGAGAFALAACALVVVGEGLRPWLAAELHPSDRAAVLAIVNLARRSTLGFAAWAAASVAGAAAAIDASIRGRLQRALVAVGLTALAGTWFWFGGVVPATAREATLVSFSRRVDALVPPAASIDYVGTPDCDSTFYLRHTVVPFVPWPPRCEPGARRYFVVPEDFAARLGPAALWCARKLTVSRPVDSHGRRILFLLQ